MPVMIGESKTRIAVVMSTCAQPMWPMGQIRPDDSMIVEASYRLVVFGAEAPHVAALAKVLWARGVEIMTNLKI